MVKYTECLSSDLEISLVLRDLNIMELIRFHVCVCLSLVIM